MPRNPLGESTEMYLLAVLLLEERSEEATVSLLAGEMGLGMSTVSEKRKSMVVLLGLLSLYDAFSRAYRYACLCVEACAFVAGIRIDDIDIVASCNGVDWAFWFAGTTVGAFLSYSKCHGFLLFWGYVTGIHDAFSG
ncbi:hypothetical protein Ptc2401_00584 [Prosthecochloris sp. CIB 2401]|nr:hypothetical protein Ptc2401_00584 [Prosthecochloris sp. CIB 2401]